MRLFRDYLAAQEDLRMARYELADARILGTVDEALLDDVELAECHAARVKVLYQVAQSKKGRSPS